MKNKKGLSQIVTTVIIILLVIIAIGLIWTVVNNLLVNSSNKITNSQACLSVNIQASKVSHVASGTGENYTITLKRSLDGDGSATAKVIIYNATNNTVQLAFNGEFTPGDVKTQTIPTNLTNGTELDVNFFVKDGSDNVIPCGKTSFQFS